MKSLHESFVDRKSLNRGRVSRIADGTLGAINSLPFQIERYTDAARTHRARDEEGEKL